MRALFWHFIGWRRNAPWEWIPYLSLATTPTEYSLGLYWLKFSLYIEIRRITL